MLTRYSFTRRRLVSALVPAAICIASFGAPAEAASVTYTGGVPGGTDPVGGVYYVGPTGGGLVQFQEIAGLQPDPTHQVLFNPVGTMLANATSFTLAITGSADMILPLDRDFGNYFETFAPDDTILSDWAASVNAAGTAITYTAAAGEELLAGQRFGTTTTFSLFNDLPPDFSYSITWTGDAIAGVPEASTWAMMLVGFGAIGLMTRRRQRVTVRLGA